MDKQKIKNNFKKSLGGTRSALESFGRAILIPVSIIPLLALIGALGYAMQSIATAAGTYTGGVKQAADAIKNIGMIAITNINFLVAIGLAAGLAKEEKISAALSGLMALAAIYTASNLMIGVVSPEMLNDPKKYGLITRFGVLGYQYNAFGGMVAGFLAFAVHKYTYKMKFPAYFAFFGGPRFSPVATTLVAWVIGMPLALVWIPISEALLTFGEGLASLGPASPFLYGLTNRALIPFGLHQVVNYFLYYTSVGGSWTTPDGKVIEGVYNIAQAKLGYDTFITAKSTWIINGTFPTNMFALPAATMAMYFCIPKANRKIVGGVLISSVMTSFLAGTTEPIEFTILFSAPWLYLMHVFLTGFTYMFMWLGDFAQVSTRGSGLITWIVVNAINWNKIENVWGIFVVGPAMGALYFISFFFMIKYFKFKTPGANGADITMYSKKDYKQKVEHKKQNKDKGDDEMEQLADTIITAFGGLENIEVLTNCVSRLRVTVKNMDNVDQEALKSTTTLGIKVQGNKIQVIYGQKVTFIARACKDYLGVID